jgi:hypothetical protein
MKSILCVSLTLLLESLSLSHHGMPFSQAADKIILKIWKVAANTVPCTERAVVDSQEGRCFTLEIRRIFSHKPSDMKMFSLLDNQHVIK